MNSTALHETTWHGGARQPSCFLFPVNQSIPISKRNLNSSTCIHPQPPLQNSSLTPAINAPLIQDPLHPHHQQQTYMDTTQTHPQPRILPRSRPEPRAPTPFSMLSASASDSDSSLSDSAYRLGRSYTYGSSALDERTPPSTSNGDTASTSRETQRGRTEGESSRDRNRESTGDGDEKGDGVARRRRVGLRGRVRRILSFGCGGGRQVVD